MSNALFPYVVMRRDPHGRTPIASLSDGIHLTLIYVESDGASKIMFREDVEALGLDPAAVYLDSRERLARLVKARLVRMRAVVGPSGVRCLAFEHSFLAASCAVLPNLFDLAHRELGADTMCLAIARRDYLVVMPNLGAAFRRDMQRMLETEDCIFSLDPSGPGWMPDEHPQIVGANLSNDGAIPVTVQSVDEMEVTNEVPVGLAFQPRPSRETHSVRRTVTIRKRCA